MGDVFLPLRDLDAQTLTHADTPIGWILRALQTVEEPKDLLICSRHGMKPITTSYERLLVRKH